jgi:hypothetical protein
MIKTFEKAKSDFYMIGHFLDISLNRSYERMQVNRIRLDMNSKVENLIKSLKST